LLKSILVLILAMASIQFGASQAKQLFPILGTAGTSTLRLIFASIMMLLAFRPWNTKFTRPMIKSLMLYGASLGLMNFSFYFALQRIPLGIAVALEFLGPLSVAIFSSKKKIDYLWAVLAGIGIYLLLPKATADVQLDLAGMLLAILAGAFWALYIIFGKKAGNNLKGGVASSMGMLFAALIVFPFGFAIDGTKLFNTQALPMALMVALFGSALPYTLEMYSLKRMPQQTFGVLMSLEPALAALMGLLFLSETLTLQQTLAIGCVVVSSLGSTYSSSQAS
jgi:inner membrane transporter RhtA